MRMRIGGFASRTLAITGAALLLGTAGCHRQVRLEPRTGASATTTAAAQEAPAAPPLLEVPPSPDPPPSFALDGKPYCFAGTNNYYLTYKSRRMVDDVLDRAVQLGLDVIRIWGFLDIGSLDRAVPAVDNRDDPLGAKDGVYFRYWDPAQGRPVVNEGEDGMPRLDYVLHAARTRGLKLLIVLTNNWRDFGGMDQYIVWYGARYHHEFYTDEAIRAAYKEWLETIVLRENSISGVVYRDDPTIFAWELANEPRCRNDAAFDSPEGWDKTTIATWVDEMSRHLKSLDPNHMVGVGDEGFLDDADPHWTHSGHEGVDHEALSAVEHIDYATFHLYPDHWQTDIEFGYDWIRDHLDVARRIGKPVMLEEYAVAVARNPSTFEVISGWKRRETAYTNYHNLLRQGGAAAALFWMLGGVDDEHGTYPDYDRFTIYFGEPGGDLIHRNALAFKKDAVACRFAGERIADVPASPFVSALRLPRGEQP